MRLKISFMSLILILVTHAALASGASPTCNLIFTAGSVYRAANLDSISLQSLVGSRISYTGSYVYTDPSDRRTIAGEGLVLRVGSWDRDSMPSFSLQLLNEKNELRQVQVFRADPTFQLNRLAESPLEAITTRIEQSGLTFQLVPFHLDNLALATHLRAQPVTRIQVVYIDRSVSPAVVREFGADRIDIPTDHDIVVGPLLGRPQAKFVFHAGQDSVSLDATQLIGFAK